MSVVMDWLPIGVSIAALALSFFTFRRVGRQEKRAHEHNDVIWHGYWETTSEGSADFYLENRGTTSARDVRVRYMSGAGEHRTKVGLGRFAPGSKKKVETVSSESHAAAELLVALFSQQSAECKVNWVSPMGSAMEETVDVDY